MESLAFLATTQKVSIVVLLLKSNMFSSHHMTKNDGLAIMFRRSYHKPTSIQVPLLSLRGGT